MRTPPAARPRRKPITNSIRLDMANAAVGFLGDIYDLDNAQVDALARTEVVWRNGRRRRMAYYRPAHTRTGRPPYISVTIPPGDVVRWVTYDRVHALRTTPPGGVVVPIRLRIVLCLVHEYTHAIQDGICGGKKRRFLEAEPTKNEIEYARRNSPEAYSQLVPSRRRGASRNDSAESSASHAHRTKGVLDRLLRARRRNK